MGSTLFSTKVLVLAALEAPLVGAVKESLGLGSILLCAEMLVLTRGGVCALESVLLSIKVLVLVLVLAALVAKASFGDTVTVLPIDVAPEASTRTGGWGGLALTADPVVGEADAATVELLVATAFGGMATILLVFGDTATVFPQACVGAAVTPGSLAALEATAFTFVVREPVAAGDPALVGEIDTSTVELEVAPEAST